MASVFFVAALALSPSCRRPTTDADMAAYVPSDTVVLAGLDLAKLRASPLRQEAPQLAPFLDTFGEASRMLLAYNGRQLVTVARGPFRSAPAGWTAVAPGLAVSGLGAAPPQRTAGAPSRLLADAASLGAAKPVWIVVPGGTVLPLSGNAANLNRLLRDAAFGAVTVDLGAQVRIEATVLARTPEAAGDIEGTLRGILAMAGMLEKRRSSTAAAIAAIQVRRDGRTVRAEVEVTADTAGKLLNALSR